MARIPAEILDILRVAGGIRVIFDRREQVRLLNQDIMGEHDAILHYLTHAWTVAYHFGPQIDQIAKDEMRHLKWLAHSVVALQGVPDLTTPQVIPVADIRGALEADIHAEQVAIAQYHAHSEQIADNRIQALLQRIIVDEECHLRLFREFLDQQHGQPWGAEGDPEAVAALATKLQALVAMEYQQVISYLFSSFVSIHMRAIGMDFEDQAVDEMKHLGWIGEQLASLGYAPSFHQRPMGDHEMTRYLEVRHWSQLHHPALVPLLDRIIGHERYQEEMVPDGQWTVGTMIGAQNLRQTTDD